jgi:hypothetical protein
MAMPSDTALAAEPARWRTLLRNNELSLALSAPFAYAVGGSWAYNTSEAELGRGPLSIAACLATAQFWSETQ